MLKNNIYNLDNEFDYSTIKSIVVKSLEKIAKQEALKKKSNIPDDVIPDCEGNGDPNSVNFVAPLTSLSKLKIQQYLRISNMAYCYFKPR
ncbi:MAG: hypothetical protein ACJ72V_03215 [Nitrososphaeraceae archaeon]